MQRALYCSSLPLISAGLVYAFGRGGDMVVGAAVLAAGALLLGLALPVRRSNESAGG